MEWYNTLLTQGRWKLAKHSKQEKTREHEEDIDTNQVGVEERQVGSGRNRRCYLARIGTFYRNDYLGHSSNI